MRERMKGNKPAPKPAEPVENKEATASKVAPDEKKVETAPVPPVQEARKVEEKAPIVQGELQNNQGEVEGEEQYSDIDTMFEKKVQNNEFEEVKDDPFDEYTNGQGK